MIALLQQGWPLLAQGQMDEDAVVIGIMVVVFIVVMVVVIAIQCFILWLLYNAYRVVPPQYQLLEPWQIWLMLIPCFNIVWVFFVYQRIPESFQRCMHALGRTDQGDCGQQLGLWYGICVVCSMVPYIGSIAGLASLVLLIIFLIKMYELKRIVETGQLQAQAAGQPGYFVGGDPSNPYASPGQAPPKDNPFA